MAKVTIVISSPVIENVPKISPPDQLPVGILFRWFNPVFSRTEKFIRQDINETKLNCIQ
ncbi:MAG: hypothetical protein ACK4WI_22220 [Microcystis sp.]|uniref:hypothetical protein n=1 Tax=Microcystis sp. TaxID=1127 RepID=UPI00391BCC3B